MTLVVARVVLAGMFAIAAIAKLSDRDGIGRAVAGFGVASAVAAPVGWVIAPAELVTAGVLLLGPAAVGGMAALVLLAGFSAVVGWNLARGRRPECHCFGRFSSGPLGWSTLARNGSFATVAAFVALDGQFGWPLVALATTLLGVWLVPGVHRRWVARPGARPAGFVLPDREGRYWTLEMLLESRQPLVLIFSQPRCGPCAALLPELAQWQRELDGRITIAVLSGGADPGLSVDDGLRRVLVDERRASFAAFGITATPSAALVNPEGRLAAAPARGAGAIRDLIDQAVKSSAAARFARRGVLSRAVSLASVAVVPAAVTAWGSGTAGAKPGDTDALEVDGAWICNQTFALCTTAPCVPSATDPGISICDCVMQNGYSVGFTSCTERAQRGNTVRSAFSTVNVNPSFGVMACPAGVPWANCLDVECEIDPRNPAVAHCQCLTVNTGESRTFGGGCDTATCTSTIWSAATPDLPGSEQFKKAMHELGQPVHLPATCPASAPSTPSTTTPAG
jgi:hypothetical protein